MMDKLKAMCCGGKKEETSTEKVAQSEGLPPGAVPGAPAPAGAAAAQPGASAAAGAAGAAEDANPIADDKMKIAVQGGGGKSGKVEIFAEAELVHAPNDPEAVAARKSHKKDKSGQDFDSKRKEYVYEYLNKEGGYLLDPANKKNVIRVEPGTL